MRQSLGPHVTIAGSRDQQYQLPLALHLLTLLISWNFDLGAKLAGILSLLLHKYWVRENLTPQLEISNYF